MKRKAQSISINTIIIAAIGLAVLVVLFAIFTGRLGKFTLGVEKTDTCDQKCLSLNMDTALAPQSDAKTCPQGQYVAGSYSDGKYGCCCVPKS
ncbi:hypothetical protein HY637_03210 [Candidatus Woesearchaeota archaeon]|nr:hypothetical protein [Candidatus Woesearchaeota archaeon]